MNNMLVKFPYLEKKKWDREIYPHPFNPVTWKVSTTTICQKSGRSIFPKFPNLVFPLLLDQNKTCENQRVENQFAKFSVLFSFIEF